MPRMTPGERLPPLELENVLGTKIPIPSPDHLVHLQFRRFAGCPMCNLHVRSFASRQAELATAGIRTVAVFHSEGRVLREYQAGTPVQLVADPKKVLYRRFGVESSLLSVLHPAAMVAALRGMLKHGMGLPRPGESPLGLPADFLVDATGLLVASKYGTHAHDQWSVDELLEHARRSLQHP